MYQRMSPDNLSTATTSIRKSNSSNFKSNKEDQQNCAENGRIPSSNGNGTSAATATATSSTTLEGNNNGSIQHKSPPPHHHHHQQEDTHHPHHHQASSSSAVHQSHESSPSRSGACLGGDMLLQWGPRKRSRCSRTEGRSMVSVVLEKHSNHIMPPPHLPPLSGPSTSCNGSRSGGSSRVRPGLLYAKDSPSFLSSKTRNVVDQMGATTSASPSRNGSGNSSRPISRSTVGKRSPSCTEKNNEKKICSSSGTTIIRKVKSEDSIVRVASGNGTQNHVEGGGEQQQNQNEHGGAGSGHAVSMARSPVGDADKGGLSEVVEWPRIYLSLSRKEKEDDFYAMKGTKLPHRPKKRAKAVDRALQYCFPGLWLSDLTRARYEVRERKSAKKPKRRGLKGLETMESDSE